jgi:hypothetical protein
MVFQQIRDYYFELQRIIPTEWKHFQRVDYHPPESTDSPEAYDLRRLLHTYRSPSNPAATEEYRHNYLQVTKGLSERDILKGEPFEFFEPADLTRFPESRIPAPGILQLPIRMHPDQVITSTDLLPETGFTIHPLIDYLITAKYPEYRSIINRLCRPLGTTDATFNDFNKEQVETPPVPKELNDAIIPLIRIIIGAQPYQPLHYVDVLYAKLPLSTGASYFYRHSYDMRTHAAYSCPKDYSHKPSSKGYFYNAYNEFSRTVVHRIKTYGLPFSPEDLTKTEIDDKLRNFFISHATMLFTRNHISDRDGNLKQRPVYAMDTLFIHLECMITFPLHIHARSMKSCIMYSLETIRGGCRYMDNIASQYNSFLCIDWSSYDQRMPYHIIETFFTLFIPSLIVINHAYQPTVEYPTYPDLSSTDMANRIFNILCFIRLWYFNCVYVTADGYAYIRTLAGVASGMFNTQYLDSYCNLYLLIHALFHFGCTPEEIMEISFFIMGDDNVLLTLWEAKRLYAFMLFLEKHALERFNMVLSTKKSIFTTLRSKIEMLGYTCTYGNATRNSDKLIAQLCFPERGPRDKFMSARAIGIAYASAGNDLKLYNFCRDVYHTFLPYADTSEEVMRGNLARYLPGMFRVLDDPTEFLNVERFPTIDEIRIRYRRWSGPLDPTTRWNIAHFIELPGESLTDIQTLEDYMSANNMQFPDVQRLF